MQDPDDIICWRRHSDRLTSSGQPDLDQFTRLRATGATHLINLAPYDNDKAMPDEPQIAADLGFDYTYIPVDFDAPTESDYAAFCTALEAQSGAISHVHCIYNARVSAFFLRYALEKRGSESVEDAMARLESIWRPGRVWCAFIGLPDPSRDENHYLGYDY